MGSWTSDNALGAAMWISVGAALCAVAVVAYSAHEADQRVRGACVIQRLAHREVADLDAAEWLCANERRAAYFAGLVESGEEHR